MINYEDAGFDEYLNRKIGEHLEDIPGFSLSALAADTLIEGISGNKILASGIIQSQNGRIKIDLTNGTITISDGATDRILIGHQVGGF